MLQCRVCGHPPDVQPIVSLARAPKIMLVGQAPGKVEAEGGAPFSGRAGRTLFRWFESVGIDEETLRARVYIAAITRCFPGANASGRGDRVPSPAERSNCSKWLSAELRIIRPTLLIPVGRLAIDAFLGPRPLEEAIGRAHAIEHDGGRSTAVPLPHPSGASSWIHQDDHKRLLGDALKLIECHWKSIYARKRVA
jgi:uracil-DNA glycosylase